MKQDKMAEGKSWYNFWVIILSILLALDFGGVYAVYSYSYECPAILGCSYLDFVWSVTLVIVLLGVPLIGYYRTGHGGQGLLYESGLFEDAEEPEDNPDWYGVCVLRVVRGGRRVGVTLPINVDGIRRLYSVTVDDRLINRRKMERLGVCRQAVFKQLMLNLRTSQLVEKSGRSWYVTDELVEAMRVLLLD